MKTKISLFYKNAIVLPEFARCGSNYALAASLSADLMRLGFIPSKELTETLMSAPTETLEKVYIITPFVQVGTYPTRNFATLGPL